MISDIHSNVYLHSQFTYVVCVDRYDVNVHSDAVGCMCRWQRSYVVSYPSHTSELSAVCACVWKIKRQVKRVINFKADSFIIHFVVYSQLSGQQLCASIFCLLFWILPTISKYSLFYKKSIQKTKEYCCFIK